MILFRLPPEAVATGGPGHDYATRMAAALTRAGHSAAISDRPATTGDTVVIDGLLLPTLPLGTVAGAIGLLHHAASRPVGQGKTADGRSGIEDALRERLPVLRSLICTSPGTASRILTAFGLHATIVAPGADAVRDHLPVTLTRSLTILSTGVLTPRKGHDILLQALALLPDLDWTLTIAGHGGRDPAWQAALTTAASAPGLHGRVMIATDPDAATLDSLYETAALFVLLTRWEGYPAAIAQALGRGIPVVTTAEGMAGLPDDAQAGALLVDTADLPTVSKVLRRTLCDPALRHSLAIAAARAGGHLPDWATQARHFAAAIGLGV